MGVQQAGPHGTARMLALETNTPMLGAALTASIGALRVVGARLHKGLHLLQVCQLDEVQAAPLELVVIELRARATGGRRAGSFRTGGSWAVRQEDSNVQATAPGPAPCPVHQLDSKQGVAHSHSPPHTPRRCT